MGGKRQRKAWWPRIIYVYVVLAARIYLLRCYTKNVKTDLSTDEKKELRLIANHLKGVQ